MFYNTVLSKRTALLNSLIYRVQNNLITFYYFVNWKLTFRSLCTLKRRRFVAELKILVSEAHSLINQVLIYTMPNSNQLRKAPSISENSTIDLIIQSE